jgi:hypothetical protein
MRYGSGGRGNAHTHARHLSMAQRSGGRIPPEEHLADAEAEHEGDDV